MNYTKILCVLLLSLVFLTHASDDRVKGVWKQVNSNTIYEIGAQFFIRYKYDLLTTVLADPELVGSYFIGQGFMLVRYHDANVDADFFDYNFTESGNLLLTDYVYGNTIELQKRAPNGAEGVWQFRIDNSILFSDDIGLAYIKSGLMHLYMENDDLLIAVFNNWACSPSGTTNMYSVLKTNTNLLSSLLDPLLNSLVTCNTNTGGYKIGTNQYLENRKTATPIDGTYSARIGVCYHHLEYEKGFFREVVTGNRVNCTASTYKYGVYEFGSGSTMTLRYYSPSGVSSETVYYSKSDASLTIDGQVYNATFPNDRVFTVIGIPYDPLVTLVLDLVDLLVDLLLNLLTLLGEPIDFDKFDILKVPSLLKRQSPERYIVFNDYPENSENIERIESYDSNPSPIPSDSSNGSQNTGSLDSNSGPNSGSSSDPSNSGSSGSQTSSSGSSQGTSSSSGIYIQSESSEKQEISENQNQVSATSPDSPQNTEIIIIIVIISVVTVGAIAVFLFVLKNCTHVKY